MTLCPGPLCVPGVQQGFCDYGLGAGALLRPPSRHPRLIPHPILRPGQALRGHLHDSQVENTRTQYVCVSHFSC